MAEAEVLILGAGFTGSRVAKRLLARGLSVTCTHRSLIDFTRPESHSQLLALVRPGCIVLHSIPTLERACDRTFVKALGDFPSRVVYLSTTAVYGAAECVNENTPVQPRNVRQRARLETEQAVASGPWSSLILRPAAIYGPGRGIHVSIEARKFKLLGDGSNFISRIHVDDLAAITEAALLSHVTGAFPVADEHSCTSREIAEFCSRLLDLPMPPSADRSQIPESRQRNRRVDGAAIRQLLGITLQYPSYRTGILASRQAQTGR